MAQHNELGKWGESVAYDFLVSRGYSILATNHRVAGIEIDIIAQLDNSIAFVEVKTRKSPIYDPLEAITPQKKMRLARAADAWLRMTRVPWRPQFDIIAVVGNQQDFEVTHYPDAFLPPLRCY